MLNKKFASIRATANVKTEKRSSMASGDNNIINHHQQQQQNQRLSQSQSMEMFGGINNEMLMSMRSSPSLYDQKTSLNSSSPINNHANNTTIQASPHLRGAMLMKASPHPYVNLLHHQYQNNNNALPQQHLQYQNTSSGSMSFGSPIILDSSSPNISINNSTCQNQQWNSTPSLNSSTATASPLGTHYTAAQIYMRPKIHLQPQPSNSSSPVVSHKKLAPEVPKRMSSAIVGTKKHNGLSRSSKFFLMINKNYFLKLIKK